MNKKLTTIAALALLLCLCLAVSACGKQKPGNTEPSGTTTQNADTTAGTTESTTPTGSTEGTTGGQSDPTEPTLESDTTVGSGRVEGESSGNQQQETTPPATKPKDPDTSVDDGLSLSYTQYMALTGKQQQEFYDKHFSDDPLAFAAWFQKIKQEYDDETPEIIATGPVDIGDYITP